jgi:hypothetical protein
MERFESLPTEETPLPQEDSWEGETALAEATPIDWGATMSYFEALFARNPSDAEVRALSESLSEMYPADKETITALAELPGFFATERDLEESRRMEEMGYLSKEARKEEYRKRMRLVERLTEYQFLLTDLIVRSKDREYLLRFWDSTEKLAAIDHSQPEMGKMKDAVLSQAAIYLLFDELGKHPRLSHPKEDAFNAIDLWTDDHQAIQVKGAPKSETFEVVPAADTIAFPGIAFADGQKTKHYNSYITAERQYLRAKLDHYAKATNQEIEGYLMVIPRNRRDQVTGQPDASIVEAARGVFAKD